MSLQNKAQYMREYKIILNHEHTLFYYSKCVTCRKVQLRATGVVSSRRVRCRVRLVAQFSRVKFLSPLPLTPSSFDCEIYLFR